MPLLVQITLLGVLGAITGSMVNWAIYQWAVWQHRPISPFMKPRPDKVWEEEDLEKLASLEPRTGADFIPIYGWTRLRRDASVFGKGCWVRPMLIEISWLVGLPLFFLWQTNGGLFGHAPSTAAVGSAAMLTSSMTFWFWLHTILIALMFIATFIDFDEQMIPDHVTVWGALIGLLAAAFFPESRLPLAIPTAAPNVFDLALVHYASPNKIETWHTGAYGIATCAGIFTVWIWALLPKIVPPREFRLGIIGSLKITLASMSRPRRKNDCELRTKPRKIFGLTRLYLLLLIVGLVGLVCCWLFFFSPIQKESLVSSFIGLAVGGGIIWGIRIVGGLVLGQQAMGFGDVTLMCMIGAFLGWQAALVGFVYSIAFAFVVALLLFIITRKSYLAFGPYLCMGALTAMLFWPAVWANFYRTFKLGPLLLALFTGCLILMAVLLPLVRWLKESLIGAESP